MPSLNRPVVLAIDLDETFAESSAEDRAALMNVVEHETEQVRLIYMSHESAEKLIQLAAKAELPVPDMFLADSGTTALKGDGTGTIEPLQRNIIQLWPGKEAVTRAFQDLEGVKLLPDDAPCRQGIEVASEDAMDAVREKAKSIGCHLERRGEGRHDVLPYGVDKGSTLGRWLVQENINPNLVLAFGETAGDAGLFGRGWRGAVFAHSHPALKEHTSRFHNVVQLKTDGARGVLDALREQGWMAANAKARA